MKSLFLMAALFFAGAANAGAITISHPYSHPTAAPGVPGVGFFTLTNSGRKADRLLSVESPAATSIEIHRSETRNGVMQMRALPQGVALPAGKAVDLAPGGMHLMLFGLKAPLVEGGSVPLTLRFARAGVVTTVLKVEPRADEPAAHQDHSHHH